MTCWPSLAGGSGQIVTEPRRTGHAKLQQRWPRGAESQRLQISEAAQDARELVGEAMRALDAGNPHVVRASLGLITAQLADIQRLAVEAKIGPDPAE